MMKLENGIGTWYFKGNKTKYYTGLNELIGCHIGNGVFHALGNN